VESTLSQGIELFKNGKYQLALDHLQSSGEDPTVNNLASYYLGLCYAKLEKYEDALLYLEQVVTSSENLLHIYQCRMILGYIYTITDRYELAGFEFNQLLKAGYESPQSYTALGYIAYIQNNPKKSLEFFETALELDSDNPNIQNSLGYTLADLQLDLDRAENLCKEAVKAKPNHPAYLDSLGWVFYHRGRFEDAKNFLRRALDRAGNNKTIASHLRAVIDAEKKV